MNVISVFSVILLACASVLCIALIVFLGRITRSIKAIQYEINDISTGMKPLIASATNLTEKLNRITDSADDQIEVVKKIVGKVNDRVDTILSLEEKIRSGFEGPALDILKTLSGVANGVSAFWNVLRRK